jgi:hypothetical protein
LFTEILRNDYQNFLNNAKDVLASMRNISANGPEGDNGGSGSGGGGVHAQPQANPSPVHTSLRSTGNSQSSPVVAAVPQSIAPAPARPLSSVKGTSSDIVIGMAQNIDPKNFAVFCGSLRRFSTADIVIFANSPLSDLLQEIAQKNSVTLMEYDLSQQSEELRKYHASTLRWTFIYNFFAADEMRQRYKRVWMVDVRDTFFQADPFVMLPPDQSMFYVFKGVESKTIANCGWNGGWVKDCFGQNVLSEIGSGNIICSGVSVGSMDTTWAYLQLMNSVVTGAAAAAGGQYPSSKFPSCERNGVDQGVHNVLVHQHKIPHVKVWGQRDGPVANMQAELYDNKVGTEVRNKIGELVAVAHQYDRNQGLQKKLFKEVSSLLPIALPAYDYYYY